MEATLKVGEFKTGDRNGMDPPEKFQDIKNENKGSLDISFFLKPKKMKNSRITISLLVTVAIATLYYVLSILLVRNGQFVNQYFPAQLSIENSVYNKNFIREVSPNKLVVVDTIAYEKIKDRFEIYLCEAYYYKSYGILNVFNHRVDFKNSICLNVNFLGEERISCAFVIPLGLAQPHMPPATP